MTPVETANPFFRLMLMLILSRGVGLRVNREMQPISTAEVKVL